MLLKKLGLVALLGTCTLGYAQSVLTNDSVKKLVAAGLPADAVVRIINTQAGTYSCGPSETAVLRQAGVPAAVLAAMAAHQDSASHAAESAPSTVGGPTLRDGTPIRLRLTRTLSSGQDRTGDKVDFEVLDDVRVGEQIVIARGSKAIGAITEAEPKRRMGRAGKLDMVLEYVRMSDGTKASLRASRLTSGSSHAGAMTAGIVATSLVVWPAAPLFLLMHGKDATVPEGTEITAYVDGDVALRPAATVSSSF